MIGNRLGNGDERVLMKRHRKIVSSQCGGVDGPGGRKTAGLRTFQTERGLAVSQGGIDPGETALEAVKREVREEVGFLPSQYELVESRGGYR